MDSRTHAHIATVAGLGRKLGSVGFLIPAAAMGATVALAIAGYVPPAIQPAHATATQSASAAELKSVDTSNVEKQSGEPTTGVSLSASDYSIDAPNGYADGVYLGSAEGYEGPMTVRVSISGGKISQIELVSSMDDEPYFGRAWNVVPGRIIDAQTANVDTVTGATYSSEGIRGAVNDALKKAAAAAGSTPSPDPVPTPEPEPTPDPNPTPDPEPSINYEDGVYTGYALCKNEKDAEAFTPYYLKLSVTIENGKVAAIDNIEGVSQAPSLGEALDPFDEANQSYLDYASDGRTLRGTQYEGVPAQLLAGKQPSQIDVVSRATYSSRAIAKAYADALDQAARAWQDKHAEGAGGNASSSGTDKDSADAAEENGSTSSEGNSSGASEEAAHA